MLSTLLTSTLFSTMISQSLMDLIGTILIFYTGYLIFKNKETVPNLKATLTSKYFILFYCWVVWILISFLFGANGYSRLLGRVLEFKWIFYTVTMLYCLKHLQEKHFRIMTYCLAILGFLSLHIFVFNKDYMSGREFTVHLPRAGGFLGDPMAFAHGLGLLSLFLVGYFSRMKSLSNKYILFSMGLIFFTIIMTLTRGVWVAVIVAMSVYFLIKSWKQLLGFILAILLLGALGYTFTESIKSRVDQAINYKTSYDTERTVLWETNIYIFKQNPIFGIGYGENKHRLREYYDTLNVPPGQFEGNAHNQYINFLSGTGVIGLLFYLAWLGMGLYWAFKLSISKMASIQEQALGFGSFLAQIVLIVGSLTESVFEHSKIKTILAFFWAISFYGYYLQNIKQSKKDSTL